MRTTPNAWTFTRSSRYVCPCCRLRQIFLPSIEFDLRRFSTKKQDDRIAPAASAVDVEDRKTGAAPLDADHSTKHRLKGSKRKSKSVSSSKSKSLSSTESVKTPVPAKRTKVQLAETAHKLSNKNKANPRASTSSSPEEQNSTKGSNDDKPGLLASKTGSKISRKPVKKHSKKKISAKDDASSTTSTQKSTAALGRNVRRRKVDHVLKPNGESGAAIIDGNNPRTSKKPPQANQVNARKRRGRNQHRPLIRKTGRFFRKTHPSKTTIVHAMLAARLLAQKQRRTKIRKVQRPGNLDPVNLEREKGRIGTKTRGTDAGKTQSKASTKTERREPTRRELEKTTISAMGVSIKKAMKKRALKTDDSMPCLNASETSLSTVDVKHSPVPQLAHGLERVLFNPGIHHVRDPRTRTFNFDPHVEKLMPVQEFNFDSLNIFTPPSKDETLARIARDSNKKYLASTSSLTGTLRHFHYLLSQWRPINFSLLSKEFPALLTSFTKLQRAPEAMFLRWKDGIYAIDSDKEYDSANVLSLMGRYMEKLLTVGREGFMRHKVGSPYPITEEERAEPEAYHYSTLGDFILRSQLDAHDSRLPGSGIFDLKTRAVVPIRMDSANYEWGTGYEIRTVAGEWQSFEREYHDMIRSTMLKYSLQVRMGRMDGILVAFHNIARIFGFQYISLEEMDNALHGQWDRTLGDREFLLSLRLLNDILNKATENHPKQTLRFHFETRPSTTNLPFMYIFAEPVTEEQADAIQSTNKHKIEEWERSLLHGAPSHAAESDSSGTHENGKLTLDESEIKSAAYNIEQDVTSEFLPQSGDQEWQDRSTESSSDPEATSLSLPKELRESELDADKSEVSEDPGPLTAYVLSVTNHVNEKTVPRPRNPMTEADKWEISYSLSPVEDPVRAWKLYDMCRQRRYKEMSEESKQDDENDFYKNILKRVTADGRRWREQIEQQEQNERAEGKEIKTLWSEASHRAPKEKAAEKRSFVSWLFGG